MCYHSNHAFEPQYPLYSVGGRGTSESLTDLVDSLKLVCMGISDVAVPGRNPVVHFDRITAFEAL